MVILPPSAVSVVLLASEVMMPVVMLFSAWMFISPAFPALVLLAEMVLFGAVISPVLILMVPPFPSPVVSVII